jgi:hypothetical protein
MAFLLKIECPERGKQSEEKRDFIADKNRARWSRGFTSAGRPLSNRIGIFDRGWPPLDPQRRPMVT